MFANLNYFLHENSQNEDKIYIRFLSKIIPRIELVGNLEIFFKGLQGLFKSRVLYSRITDLCPKV